MGYVLLGFIVIIALLTAVILIQRKVIISSNIKNDSLTRAIMEMNKIDNAKENFIREQEEIFTEKEQEEKTVFNNSVDAINQFNKLQNKRNGKG